MKAVIQRVTEAGIKIANEFHTGISNGLLVFIGIEKGDTIDHIKYISNKIINLRIFSDSQDKMNLSVGDINGEILVVSQFTLCTDKNKSGNRPSFSQSETPEMALNLYNLFIENLKSNYSALKIRSGVFSEYMEVSLINDGPVTIILEK
jgi:D-aminoacyl-tRNA deacylase